MVLGFNDLLYRNYRLYYFVMHEIAYLVRLLGRIYLENYFIHFKKCKQWNMNHLL